MGSILKIVTYSGIFGWLTCFTVLNILVKRMSISVRLPSLLEDLLHMAQSPAFYIAGLLYVTCALLYFLMLSRLPLSTAGPLFMVLGIVSTTAIGFWVFGEAIGAMKIAGLAVCLVGIGMIMRGTN